MKRSLTTINVDKIFIILYFSWLFINVVSHTIANFLTGIGNILLIYLFYLYAACFYGKKSKKTIKLYALWGFLFLFIIFRQFIWKNGNMHDLFFFQIENVVWNLVSFIPLILTAITILEKSTDELTVWCRRVFIFCLLLVSISSIAILAIDSNAARLSSTSEGHFVPFLIDYGTVYGLAIILPFMLIWAKKTQRKFFAWGTICLLMLAMVMANFFIAILATLLGLFLFLIFRISNKIVRYIILSTMIVLFGIMLFSDIMPQILLGLANYVSSSQFKERLEELALFFKDGTMDNTTARLELYIDAFKKWLKHPIFGNIIHDTKFFESGHSANLDILSGCGIFVFTLWFKFIYNIKKSNGYDNRTKQAAINASFITFLFICTFNPIFATSQIMVLYILGPSLFMGTNNETGNEQCVLLK